MPPNIKKKKKNIMLSRKPSEVHTALQRRCLILFTFSLKQTLTALPGLLTHSYYVVACQLSPRLLSNVDKS
jgi:hypothetical protein